MNDSRHATTTMTLLRRALPIALLLACTAICSAQSSGWTITTRDTVYKGTTLLDVRDDTLYFEPKREIIGQSLRLAMPFDELVELRRGHLSGAIVGAIPGAVAGSLGWVLGDSRTYGDQWFTAGETSLILGGFAALTGAIIGAVLDPGDTVIELAGRTEPQKRAALARIIMFDKE
jgi:hypothetical protein